jgi:receptor expression-enhancing protein 5/6
MTKTNKDSLTQYEILEESLDIPARYVVSSLLFCAFLVFFGYLDIQVTNVVGIVFPVYWTIKAIESPSDLDDRQWLTYWAIFTALLTSDFFFGFYLAKIPYFYFIKLCFLVWLFLPNTRGALLIHENLIKRHISTLDSERVKGVLTRIFGNTKELTLDVLDSVKEVAQKIIQVPEAIVETSESYIDRAAEVIGSKLVENYSDQPLRDNSGRGDEGTKAEADITQQGQQQQRDGDFEDIKRSNRVVESDEPRRRDLIEQ